MKSSSRDERGAGAGLDAADQDDLRAALAVSGHLDLGDQLREILAQAVAWGGGSSGFAYVADPENGGLVCAASTLAESDERRAAMQRLDPDLVARHVVGEETQLAGIDPLVPAEAGWLQARPRSCLALRVDGVATESVALLLLVGESAPADPVRQRIRRLLDLTRRAMANAIQVRAVRELVIKDDTADCFNRRHFEDFLVEEMARASRFRAPVSLIFFDMDNLKEVNTRLGHAMGSRSLYEVSLRVRARIRKFDKLFRFGGDEFCVVLPETEWHGALEVAERVRESIATKPFLATQPLAQGGIRMTASFGVASFPLHARSKEDLVQRADRAMQRIKAGSKNSIAVAEIVRDDDGA